LIIELRAVSKVYAPRRGGRPIQALTAVSLEVKAGELVVLTGPSGAGKSTVLRLLTGEERPTEGAVVVDGEEPGRLGPRALARLRRRLGVVPQEARLLDDRTAVENVALVVRALGGSRRAARTRAVALLRETGLAGRASAFPAELAAGERQRLLVARALASDPRLLLADEPLGTAAGTPDGSGGDGIVGLLRQIQARGVTVVVASQAPSMATALGGRVLRLEAGRLVNGDSAAPAHGAP
jgi:cell division transport system ATP-binding protein